MTEKWTSSRQTQSEQVMYSSQGTDLLKAKLDFPGTHQRVARRVQHITESLAGSISDRRDDSNKLGLIAISLQLQGVHFHWFVKRDVQLGIFVAVVLGIGL